MATLNKRTLVALIEDGVVPSDAPFSDNQKLYLGKVAVTAQAIAETIESHQEHQTATQLCQALQLSRNTLLQYLRVFEDRGIVTSRPKKGTEDASGRPELEYIRENQSGFISTAIEFFIKQIEKISTAFDYPAEITQNSKHGNGNTIRVAWEDHCIEIVIDPQKRYAKSSQ